ncbi:MAG TPA: arginyl-tRNA synthetase [Lacisediminihabitans sp.]|uniref:arginyl-tRNA synthetase n=1 Tax=Lacisediminihabitans sp. TaxID=2787631 RepID=UPI002EDAE58F
MKLSAARGLGRVAQVVSIAAAAVVLVGCVGTTDAGRSSSPTRTPSSSHSPSASPSAGAAGPSATPSAAAGGTPVTLPCSSLTPAQVMYDFNPNFGLDAIFTPKSGTPAARAVADRGIACNWTNQTSGDTITFSVARPAASELTALKTAAAAGTSAAGYGDAAWFSSAGQVGRVDVFRGDYWLTVSSVYFGSAADASSLISAALSALH